MLHKKRFHCGTYELEYWIVASDDPKQASKSIEKLLDQESEEQDSLDGYLGQFIWTETSPPRMVVYIYTKAPKDEILASLVHELFHCTVHVLNWAGIPLTDSSQESYSHLLDKMVRDAIPWIRQKKIIRI